MGSFYARGDMQATLKAILLDPEARNASPSGDFGRLRPPMQHTILLCRQLGIDPGLQKKISLGYSMAWTKACWMRLRVRRLFEDKRLEVRIVEDPEFLATPVINDYDVIFLHFKNYQPFRREKRRGANLANFVKQGKGLVLLHYACGAFDGWPEFIDLAGKVYDKRMTKPHSNT